MVSSKYSYLTIICLQLYGIGGLEKNISIPVRKSLSVIGYTNQVNSPEVLVQNTKKKKKKKKNHQINLGPVPGCTSTRNSP